MAENNNIIVTLTGITGYIASHIAQQLLEKDDVIVHGTVRDLENESKYAYLKELPGAKERLKFFQANLLEEGSFDEAVRGATYVLHTASPFLIDKITNPQRQLVDPAVKGTVEIFEACQRTAKDTLKRIVVTSSVAAVQGKNDERGLGHVFTEEDWNCTSTLKRGSYAYSKTQAEKAAWKKAKEYNFDLVTINPCFVMGPTLSGRSDGASVKYIKNLMDGTYKSGCPDFRYCIVHVQDVARAHVQAAFVQEAKGRYLVSASSTSMPQVAALLHETYPTLPIPTKTIPRWLMYLVGPFNGVDWHTCSSLGKPLDYDASKAERDLGMEWRDVNETLLEMAKNLIDQGIVTLPAQ